MASRVLKVVRSPNYITRAAIKVTRIPQVHSIFTAAHVKQGKPMSKLGLNGWQFLKVPVVCCL